MTFPLPPVFFYGDYVFCNTKAYTVSGFSPLLSTSGHADLLYFFPYLPSVALCGSAMIYLAPLLSRKAFLVYTSVDLMVNRKANT